MIEIESLMESIYCHGVSQPRQSLCTVIIELVMVDISTKYDCRLVADWLLPRRLRPVLGARPLYCTSEDIIIQLALLGFRSEYY